MKNMNKNDRAKLLAYMIKEDWDIVYEALDDRWNGEQQLGDESFQEAAQQELVLLESMLKELRSCIRKGDF